MFSRLGWKFSCPLDNMQYCVFSMARNLNPHRQILAMSLNVCTMASTDDLAVALVGVIVARLTSKLHEAQVTVT